MTAKEYLGQLMDMDLRIDAIKRSIKKCYSRAEKITSSTADTPSFNSGTISSKIESNVIEVVDYKKQLEGLKNEREAFKFRVICEINSIQNNMLAALLINRYVNGMTWEEVAEAIDKEVDYTKKELHSKALREFEKINHNHPTKTPVIPPSR